MPNYRIMFPQGCGIYRQGDVVNGNLLGDVNYLLRVGAIEATEDAESTTLNSVEVSAVVAQKDAEIATLNATIASLNAQLNKSTLKSQLTAKEQEVTALEAEVTALKAQVEALNKQIEESSLEEVQP